MKFAPSGWRPIALAASIILAATVLTGSPQLSAAAPREPEPVAAANPSAAPPAAAVSALAPRQVARAAYARMSWRQRVGQLFMVAVPTSGASSADLATLRAARAGGVYLGTNSTAGRSAVRAAVSAMSGALTHAGVRPLIGVDQEGGEVQRLRGPGFSSMPTALDQGRLSTGDLRDDAAAWGRQLRRAGVNLDLAPVADTVPASIGRRNKPIGQFRREYGHTVGRVRHHVAAFVRGMRDARVETAVKHFPGLGRATGNTDVTRRVTDPTRPGGRYLVPYTAGVSAGSRIVMVSSAIYPHIDPGHRACFSATVINGLLRGQEGFHGVVISDSLSAAAVSFVTPRQRAIKFFEAGGTIALDSALSDLPAMTSGVLAQTRQSAAFGAVIKRAVIRVLALKARDGLIG